MDAEESQLSRVVHEVLTPLLGRHTARKALELACQKSGTAVARLGDAELPVVIDNLMPMLRTLLGEQVAERVKGDIQHRGGGGGQG